MRGQRLALLSLLPLLGCELTEVTVPVGESRVVVHAIYSRFATRQFVVVEESITGETRPGSSTLDGIPPAGPALPIAGAFVMFTYDDGSACGPGADTLPPVADAPGLYQADLACRPAPGDVIGLRVETPDGRVVTGTTTVPGAERVELDVAGGVVPPASRIVLNRDRDTSRFLAEPIVARGMLVDVRRRENSAVREPVFYLPVDTLGITLPGDLVNPFEGDQGEPIFRAGFEYDLSFAVADTNVYDFARSFSDPFTGRGFLNHLEGGIGVFGSVETHSYVLRVVADVDDPREGIYQLQGMIEGVPVQIDVELYLDDLPGDQFGAFIRGGWYDGFVVASMAGFFGGFERSPDEFEGSFLYPRPLDNQLVRWQLEGRRAERGQPFPVAVTGYFTNGVVSATLTAVQATGPAR